MTKMIAELIEQRFGLPSAAGHDTPAEGELAAILSHRTHRRYTETPISEDLMQQVLAAGLSAPAKSDLQQVAIVRVENAGIRQAIAELLPSMPWVAQAARFLVVCGDSRRIRRICELRGIPFANDHLDAFLNAASDAAHGAAKSDPCGKRGRAWRMPYQRDPQSCGADCRIAGAPRSCISAGGTLPWLAVTGGICQHSLADGAHGACRPL